MNKLEELDKSLEPYVTMMRQIADYMRGLGIGETFFIDQVVLLSPDVDGWGTFKFRYKVKDENV